jgi:hypothetical protein
MSLSVVVAREAVCQWWQKMVDNDPEDDRNDEMMMMMMMSCDDFSPCFCGVALQLDGYPPTPLPPVHSYFCACAFFFFCFFPSKQKKFTADFVLPRSDPIPRALSK